MTKRNLMVCPECGSARIRERMRRGWWTAEANRKPYTCLTCGHQFSAGYGIAAAVLADLDRRGDLTVHQDGCPFCVADGEVLTCPTPRGCMPDRQRQGVLDTCGPTGGDDE